MIDYLEILRLKSLGMSNTRIAEMVWCSRQSVINVLRQASQNGIRYADAKNMSDRELAEAIGKSGVSHPQYQMPDYDAVHRELAKSGVTLSLLWLEYCDGCRRSGKIPYKSTQFNKRYAEYVKKTGATMRLNRKPGESLEVDWAGGTVGISDRDTGAAIGAYVFVSALSYSGYAYAEAFWTMAEDDWIQAHVNAYSYFGGVARLLIPDNLKTGVDSNTRWDTKINKAYQELAEHYGTAVLPARVEAPNDKPNAEGAVKTVKMWILAALRNNQYFSLEELNAAIREKLEEYNSRKFQKIDASRASRFSDEKEFLLPLPKQQFERAEWSKATVQKDYHVKAGQHYYSVPYEYIGKTVDIRTTRGAIEVFFGHMRIASHKRSDAYPGKAVTEKTHMPLAHQLHGEWNGDRFRRLASEVGQSALLCVEHFLASARVEQQGYKNCSRLLHLAGKLPDGRVEAACARVLGFTASPSMKAIESVLRNWHGDLALHDGGFQPDGGVAHGFIRGADHYADGGDADD